MKLVPEAKRWYRMFSQQSILASIAIQGTWASLDDDLKASIPGTWVAGITVAVLTLGFIGRFIDQPKVHE